MSVERKELHDHNGKSNAARLMEKDEAYFNERFKLQFRRCEIASFKAELILAAQLRHANMELDRTHARLRQVYEELEETSARLSAALEALAHVERGAIGWLFFHRNGKPRRLLRLILFTRSGRPRSLTRTVVLNKRNGKPRRRFRKWMMSEAYQRLPGAYHV